MEELQKFYQTILNIRQKDMYKKIKQITLEERNAIEEYTNDLTGYCKYISLKIYERLKKENITTYLIDLKELININHVILISEYMSNNELKRILIDPTFKQFTKKDKHKLITLKEWPSEILDKNMVDKLLEDGIYEINESIFNEYLNSFGNNFNEIFLDDYLLDKKIGRNNKR